MSRLKDERDRPLFKWSDLGDVAEGRPHLGPLAPVSVYRLFQFTLRDILIARDGVQATEEAFRGAGRTAGMAFCRELLDVSLETEPFLEQAQERLRELGVGLMRIERADPSAGEFTISVAEDLDCSGLPSTDEQVCDFDEGFLAGLLEAYTGRAFRAREVDCWANGGRVCRFQVTPA